MDGFEEIIGFLSFLFLIALGFVVGKLLEARHYRSIHERERLWAAIPATSTRDLSDLRPVREARLAVGSVVVSVDYYKRFLMGFRKLFGGEVRSYSSLIDRARREAVLRMKESCPGADLYLACRLSTSTITNKRGNAFGCVEVIATATAVSFER